MKTGELVETAVRLQAEADAAAQAEADAVLRSVAAAVELEALRPALRRRLAAHEGEVFLIWRDRQGDQPGGHRKYVVCRGELRLYEPPVERYLNELDPPVPGRTPTVEEMLMASA